jgi:hypothetical protein
MLRITTDDTPDGLLVKFEGRLVGAWAREADEAWRAGPSASGRPITVDICDVSAVDERGRDLLIRMHRAGAVFAVRGCELRELVREVAEESGRLGRAALREA